MMTPKDRDELKQARIDIKYVEARIHNLELVIHVMWSMIQDTMPPQVQQDVVEIMSEHYSAAHDYNDGELFGIIFKEGIPTDTEE